MCYILYILYIYIYIYIYLCILCTSYIYIYIYYLGVLRAQPNIFDGAVFQK